MTSFTLLLLFLFYTSSNCASTLYCDEDSSCACSSGPCTIYCDDCEGSISCYADYACTIHCTGDEDGCSESTIYGNGATTIDIQCGSYYSCLTTVYCTTSICTCTTGDCNGLNLITYEPTKSPTLPTQSPSNSPTNPPTLPTKSPTNAPTLSTNSPTPSTFAPSSFPTFPTSLPTYFPSIVPTVIPTQNPSKGPTIGPTMNPTFDPTVHPSIPPLSYSPSAHPSYHPSYHQSYHPSYHPSYQPSAHPSYQPSAHPSTLLSLFPSQNPTQDPTQNPTNIPSFHLPNTTTINENPHQIHNNLFAMEAETIIVIIIGSSICICVCILLLLNIHLIQKRKRKQRILPIIDNIVLCELHTMQSASASSLESVKNKSKNISSPAMVNLPSDTIVKFKKRNANSVQTSAPKNIMNAENVIAMDDEFVDDDENEDMYVDMNDKINSNCTSLHHKQNTGEISVEFNDEINARNFSIVSSIKIEGLERHGDVQIALPMKVQTAKDFTVGNCAVVDNESTVENEEHIQRTEDIIITFDESESETDSSISSSSSSSSSSSVHTSDIRTGTVLTPI